jgi:hypothetical protein
MSEKFENTDGRYGQHHTGAGVVIIILTAILLYTMFAGQDPKLNEFKTQSNPDLSGQMIK